MGRRAAAAEPALGSDSFLDVTANLVGVLIILIVLLGVRVSKAPPQRSAVDSELERRLARIAQSIDDARARRAGLEQDLDERHRALVAHQQELDSIDHELQDTNRAMHELAEQLGAEQLGVESDAVQLAELRGRMVSLKADAEPEPAAAVAAVRLEHKSPISRPVNSSEVHLELYSGRVSYVDLEGLIHLVRGRVEGARGSRNSSAGDTGEVGPIGSFRLRYSLVTLNSLTKSLYGGRYLKWRLVPVDAERGETVDAALRGDSQLETVLRRYSASKYAVTVWVYPDSFAAFRQLRDHLADRGYSVAARLLQFGDPISGSPDGVQSYAQ